MYLEGIIGVIVGTIFTWFVLSIATVQIQEWIASLLRWRANDLQNAIRGMLCSENLVRLFYDHPIIRGLSPRKKNRDSKPSYIPANQFSTVFLSILLNAVSESAILVYGLYGLPATLNEIKSAKKRRRAQEDLNRLFEIARLANSSEDNKALDDLILVTLEKEIIALGENYAELKDSVQALIEDARVKKAKLEKDVNGLSTLGETPTQPKTVLSGALALGVINPELRLTLNALLLGTEGLNPDHADFLEQVRSNIETWFKDSMDRISGWYKRKAQFSAFIVGLICASLLNIDSIHLAVQLWREPPLREAISNNVSLVLSQYTDENGSLNVEAASNFQFLQDQYLNLPIGWNFYSVSLLPSQICSFSPKYGAIFGFPVSTGCIRPFGTGDSTNGWLWLFFKVVGLLLTGLASAQGSSFWFDMLSKIVNIRSAGRKPI
jgi:hypothetical protein